MTKSVQQQQALDSLYAIGNVLTIKVSMPQTDWDAVRTEQPASGVCNFLWTGDSRYTWRKATSVEISGTSFPPQTMFTQVGVKKKSFCGSINSDKPCLHIDFGKFSKANVPVIEALIGSRYLTLNNTIQDRSPIAPFKTIMIIRIYGASTILEPESRLPVTLTAAFSTPATRS